MELPYTLEKLREATHELIRGNKLRSCYIRPIAFRGYGEMGLFPLNAPVDVVDRRLAVGRLPRRGGQAHGIRCKVSSWRRMSPRQLHPAGEGLRPVPELDPRQGRDRQGGLRRGDPARRARQRLRGLGREHLRRARRADLDAAAQRLRSSTGSPAVGDPDRRRPRLRGRRARHRARRAVPGRRGLPDRHRRRDRAGARDRRPRARASPARSRGRSRRSSSTRSRASARSTSSGSTSSTDRSKVAS